MKGDNKVFSKWMEGITDREFDDQLETVFHEVGKRISSDHPDHFHTTMFFYALDADGDEVKGTATLQEMYDADKGEIVFTELISTILESDLLPMAFFLLREAWLPPNPEVSSMEGIVIEGRKIDGKRNAAAIYLKRIENNRFDIEAGAIEKTDGMPENMYNDGVLDSVVRRTNLRVLSIVHGFSIEVMESVITYRFDPHKRRN